MLISLLKKNIGKKVTLILVGQLEMVSTGILRFDALCPGFYRLNTADGDLVGRFNAGHVDDYHTHEGQLRLWVIK